MVITVNVFNIYDGRILEIAIPRNDYPVLETERFKRWTDKQYPCYDIKNNYMGVMQDGLFFDMRKGWYCTFCDYGTQSFWHALIHNIKHLFLMKKRKTGHLMEGTD